MSPWLCLSPAADRLTGQLWYRLLSLVLCDPPCINNGVMVVLFLPINTMLYWSINIHFVQLNMKLWYTFGAITTSCHFSVFQRTLWPRNWPLTSKIGLNHANNHGNELLGSKLYGKVVLHDFLAHFIQKLWWTSLMRLISIIYAN